QSPCLPVDLGSQTAASKVLSAAETLASKASKAPRPPLLVCSHAQRRQNGNAELLAIDPCPPIAEQPGCRTVTGVFRHQSAKIVDVHIVGLDAPIGATANHPFWSE